MSLLNQKTGVHHAAAAVEGNLSAAGPGLRVNPAEFRTRLTTAENHVTVLQLMQPPPPAVIRHAGPAAADFTHGYTPPLSAMSWF